MAERAKKVKAISDELKERLREKAQAKWRSSGLEDGHAKHLQFRILTGEDVATALGVSDERAGGLLIPYFDFNGEPTSFFRVRYLEPLPGFAGTVEKPQRYVQPAGTLNEVYLPPILAQPWSDVAKNPGASIYITEGELKAACGCAKGFATIGLGGVDVWRASKRMIDLLPQLAEIEWGKREVVIVFDSDAADNPNVVRAQRQLARALVGLGAIPTIASLPPAKDGKKQGLDDFLVAEGADAFVALLKSAPGFPEADALWEMNERMLYVRKPGLVIDLKTAQQMDPTRFCTHHFSNLHYTDISVGKGGTLVSKDKRTATRWLDWEGRAEVDGITYVPGGARIVDGKFNTWPGWGCQPKKGDVSCWKWLLDYLFKGEKPELRKWFEQWCAYPLQHPGVKMYSAAMIWGRHHGTGKTLAAYSLMGIYGDNAVEVKNKDLKGSFTGWGANRQFVYGDEISSQEARLDANWLKGLITQKDIRINVKFLPEYYLPDTINYFLSSNRPDALFMEDNDRRFMVLEVAGAPLERGFYDQYDKWLGLRRGQYTGPGREHLFDHLLKVDLKGFNPMAAAPGSKAKEEMVIHSMSDLDAWVALLKETPESALRVLGEKVAVECDLFLAQHLLRAYDPERRTRVTEPGMGRALAKAGFRFANNGKKLRTKSGVARWLLVRNPVIWERAMPVEMVEHVNKFWGSSRF